MAQPCGMQICRVCRLGEEVSRAHRSLFVLPGGSLQAARTTKGTLVRARRNRRCRHGLMRSDDVRPERYFAPPCGSYNSEDPAVPSPSPINCSALLPSHASLQTGTGLPARARR